MDTKETRNYLNSKASTSFTLLKVYYILCIYPKSYIQGILKSKQKNQKTVRSLQNEQQWQQQLVLFLRVGRISTLRRGIGWRWLAAGQQGERKVLQVVGTAWRHDNCTQFSFIVWLHIWPHYVWCERSWAKLRVPDVRTDGVRSQIPGTKTKRMLFATILCPYFAHPFHSPTWHNRALASRHDGTRYLLGGCSAHSAWHILKI